MYEVIDDKYFKQSDVEFTKDFILQYKKEFNVSHFPIVHVKKSNQHIGLEYGLFYQIVEIRQTIVGEPDTASKNKNKK